MAKINLNKSTIDAAQALTLPVCAIPWFLIFCLRSPAGRKVFMFQHRTNAGERLGSALKLYGELTVKQVGR